MPYEKLLNKLLLMRLIQLSKIIESEIALQKMVLNSKEIAEEKNFLTFNYNFADWYFGPYSEELKHDLQSLIDAGLIVQKNFEQYSITEKGAKNISKFKDVFDTVQFDRIFESIKSDFGNNSTDNSLEEKKEAHV